MNKTRCFLAALILSGSMALSSTASAAPLLFNFTSGPFGSNFSFKVDSNPFPIPSSGGFTAAIFDNAGYNSSAKTVIFYSSTSAGGFDNFLGPQLFSGSPSAPSLLTGVFALTRSGSGSVGTLTVSAVAAAVPEPATWAMLLVGFGLVGGAARYRRRTTTLAYA